MKNDFSKRLDNIPKSGIREFFDLVMSAKGIISLGVGEPDFSTPWTVREEAIYAIEKGLTSYTSNQGLLELRESISGYLNAHFKLNYDPADEILITNGVSEGVDILLRALLNPGDEVILPKPLYVCYDPLVQLAGGVVKSVDTSSTNFVPDPKQIESVITPKTKALVLCYPNNPTGLSIPKKTLQEIAKIAEKYDLWVISDEIYAEILFSGAALSFASIPGMKKRTITLNGFSKAFAMTGWRIGYLCGPEAIVSRACKIHQYSALCVSSFSQYAAIEALKNGIPEMRRMVASYKQRSQFFAKGLTEFGLTTLPPEGAFYCFSSVQSTGLSSLEFAKQLLKKEKVAVVPGTAFGPEGEGYIRSSIATSSSDLEVVLKRLNRFLGSL
ncbi:pyridoxal phosphate-dependent aminotransferase [Candidatus Marinamargulisbacteria bacterium SCGC AG-439-L15]|nr:pyridoxal phosphate-dependent aminotransferase [Candidatus Marinamargulisbacteria bacterium SCGC AG-439-L15]